MLLLPLLTFGDGIDDETDKFFSSLPHHKSPTEDKNLPITHITPEATIKSDRNKTNEIVKESNKTATAPSIVEQSDTIDSLLVIKSKSRLYLLSKGKIIKEYRVSFGKDPVGHKFKEGDQKTPEGIYTLDYKKRDSTFHRALHISYPNQVDKEKARKAGVSPGGFIMLHGQTAGEIGWFSSWAIRFFDWTDGCIAVTNEEIDEICSLVKVGTPIEIRP